MAPGGAGSSISAYEKCDLSIPWLVQSLRMIVPMPVEDTNQNLIATSLSLQPMVYNCSLK